MSLELWKIGILLVRLAQAYGSRDYEEKVKEE
jgi:hypothetical protein